MTIILALFHILLMFSLAFLVWRKQIPMWKKVFWPALAVRVIAGVCLGLLYMYYYSDGDTLVYFADASRVADLAREDFSSYFEFLIYNSHLDSLSLTYQAPRALFLTKLTSVLNIVTVDQYWISGFYFSFLSFLAAWFLVKTLTKYIPFVRLTAVIAFLFFPSIVFWTSGLLKESIAMAALFFLTAVFLKVWFDATPRVWVYVAVVLSLLLLWNLKYYYAAIFIPVVFTSLVYKYLIRERFSARPALQVALWMAIFMLPLAIVTFLHPNFNLDRIFTVMLTNNAAYNALSAPGEVVKFDELRATPFSIVKHAPLALFSGLFRPFFWEAQSLVQFLAAMENTFLLIMFVAALTRLKKVSSAEHRLLILSIVVYVVILCVFITISAPNFGTLSRYRVGYLSFFVLLILSDNPVVQRMERSISGLVSQ